MSDSNEKAPEYHFRLLGLIYLFEFVFLISFESLLRIILYLLSEAESTDPRWRLYTSISSLMFFLPFIFTLLRYFQLYELQKISNTSVLQRLTLIQKIQVIWLVLYPFMIVLGFLVIYEIGILLLSVSFQFFLTVFFKAESTRKMGVYGATSQLVGSILVFVTKIITNSQLYYSFSEITMITSILAILLNSIGIFLIFLEFFQMSSTKTHSLLQKEPEKQEKPNSDLTKSKKRIPYTYGLRSLHFIVATIFLVYSLYELTILASAFLLSTLYLFLFYPFYFQYRIQKNSYNIPIILTIALLIVSLVLTNAFRSFGGFSFVFYQFLQFLYLLTLLFFIFYRKKISASIKENFEVLLETKSYFSENLLPHAPSIMYLSSRFDDRVYYSNIENVYYVVNFYKDAFQSQLKKKSNLKFQEWLTLNNLDTTTGVEILKQIDKNSLSEKESFYLDSWLNLKV